ncbi:ankyrin repeat containing protein [Sporothrix brasiliensis 5110]|uniref:Ankyrin repeat containing protein n=1 Tax=Sporothrix brasiliensis 5110 TaxID=1398154 RepID=A0A0C2EW23_9PEZI|nr:ankyrin repeat containing protein [Sporothrix brasiliensis 5110]KIH90764.1 ankyrin repeat containing protein [Sporothrix brasiliensis 5110]
MLDHDPRYLRPESREDMNQRVKLLAGSTQRKRRPWKKHGEAQQQQQQQQQQHQHPNSQYQQPPLPPPMGHSSGYDDAMLHGIKPEIGHGPGLGHLSQHPQHHQQHQHSQHPYQAQHQQPQHHHQQPQHQMPPQPHHLSQHYPSQPSATYLPPPQSLHQHHPQQPQQQPYHDFYHQQYPQQPAPPLPQPQPQPHQHYPLSMQQMTAHHVPPFMSGSWGHVYDNQSQAADPASRLTMSNSFDLAQHQTSMAPLHAQQQHAGHAQQHLHQHPQHAQQHQQYQHPHAAHGHPHQPYHPNEHSGIDGHGNLGTLGGGITSSHLPLLSDHQRQRRMSSAAYSTDSDASSDVSTETIQDLKNRLSGCSTHYANQIANLLRRFTISNGSDDPSSPSPSVVLSGPRSGSNDNSTDSHRIRKPWRQRTQKIRSNSVSSTSSNGSFGVFDSDVDVYGEPGDDDDTTQRGQSSHGGSNPSSVAGASPDGHVDEHVRGSAMRRAGASGAGLKTTTATTATTAHATTILGASGDNAGSPRLVLPGDFFNAYQYRDDANCPFHNKEQLLRDEQERRQRQAEEDQNDRRRGRSGAKGANAKVPREKRCWCAIADAVGSVALEDGSFWVLSDGRLTPDAEAMVREPTQQRHQLARRDRFGHSMLHLFASRDGLQMQLLAMVLNCDDATLLAANTAGQTFLHVLAPSWFVGLHEPYAPLVQLLAHLRSRTRQPPAGGNVGSDAADDVNGPGSSNAMAHLIYATDVYGRSFFHRFGTFVSDPHIITNTIIQHYDRAALLRRDGFAHVPLAIMGASGSGGADDYGAWPSPTATHALVGGNVPTVFSSEDAFIRHHESLLRTVTASDNQPSVEDPEGRNGLHCMAEAIVDKRIMDEHRSALSAGRKVPKKKTLDKKDPSTATSSSSSFMNGLLLSGEGGSVGDGLGGGPTYSSTSPYVSNPALGGATSTQSLLHTSVDGAQMATRLRLVQGLLSPPIVVDVNHYDRRGQTVLTAFVVHIADDQEDKAKSLVAILETLLSAGARIEGRNRRGETPLLVAARLGRKIALTTLLDHGANVHARDAAGRGVLDILDMQCRRQGRNNVALYGRLEACRVLLTSIKQLPLGVKQRPTLMDEWTIVHRRGPEPRDISMAM